MEQMCQALYKNGDPCRLKARKDSPFCGSHANKIRQQKDREEFVSSVITGRHEALPTRLQAVYNFTLEDEDQLSLSRDIALIDTLTNDLLKRVDSGESGRLWKELKFAFKEYKRALKRKDDELIQESFEQLNELITQGASDSQARDEVLTFVEHRRRLADTDRKRLTEMGNIVSQEDGLALVTRLYEAVMLHVTDPDTRAAIALSMGPLSDEAKVQIAQGR